MAHNIFFLLGSSAQNLQSLEIWNITTISHSLSNIHSWYHNILFDIHSSFFLFNIYSNKMLYSSIHSSIFHPKQSFIITIFYLYFVIQSFSTCFRFMFFIHYSFHHQHIVNSFIDSFTYFSSRPTIGFLFIHSLMNSFHPINFFCSCRYS